MNSDDLGEKGEIIFKGWCIDASLICNKSTHDRAGWDFIVDFRHEPSAISLDRRPGPRSCVIQIKAVLKGTKYVRVRLDMAERLAKDVKPCFIVTPVIQGLGTVALRVWHIRGDHLARILKRLREEHVAGNAGNLSERYVRFPVRTGTDIDCTGAALRALFEASCTEGMSAYAAAKTREIRTLGMENEPLEMTITVQASGPVEALDFFSGRAKNVSSQIVSLTETRFGLSIPITGAPVGVGIMSLEPEASGSALIRIRAPGLASPLVDRAVVITVPFELQGHKRVELRGRYLMVCVTWQPDDVAQVLLEPVIPEGALTLNDWAAFSIATGFRYLPDAEIEFESDFAGGNQIVLPLTQDELDSPEAHNARAVIVAAARLQQLAGAAGEDVARTLSRNEMELACNSIQSLQRLEGDAYITFEAEEPAEAFDECEALVAGVVSMGEGRTLLWHGFMWLSAIALTPVIRFRLDRFRFGGVKRGGSTNNLAAYAAPIAKARAIEAAFWTEWNGRFVAGVLELPLDGMAASPGPPLPSGESPS